MNIKMKDMNGNVLFPSLQLPDNIATKEYVQTELEKFEAEDLVYYEDGAVAVQENSINALANIIYPIGSIYMSVSNVSPKALFGGDWVQIKDKFLLSAGDTYAAGTSGGEAIHTLTINEMPSHNHSLESISGYDDLNFINGDGQFHIQNSDTTVGWGDAKNAQYYYGLTGSSGGSQAHNNMPPYLTVYIWKRVA